MTKVTSHPADELQEAFHRASFPAQRPDPGSLDHAERMSGMGSGFEHIELLIWARRRPAGYGRNWKGGIQGQSLRALPLSLCIGEQRFLLTIG
jgi:hypothetical protein